MNAFFPPVIVDELMMNTDISLNEEAGSVSDVKRGSVNNVVIPTVNHVIQITNDTPSNKDNENLYFLKTLLIILMMEQPRFTTVKTLNVEHIPITMFLSTNHLLRAYNTLQH